MRAGAAGVEPARPGPASMVVALVASAGGLNALTTVLEALSPGYPSAVVVAQHLGSHGSALVEIIRRRIRLPVDWAGDGDVLTGGRVVIAPPATAVEVSPDGRTALRPMANTAGSGSLDALLISLAGSFGVRGTGVVLSGMGYDGAAGARALKDAGGIVLAQSEATADYPSMPLAAVATGAVDLVLDIHDIGPLLADVAGGGELPSGRPDRGARA